MRFITTHLARLFAPCIVLSPLAAEAARHALLVGVANYRHPDSNLIFPEQDVEVFRGYLIQQHGFEAGEIRTLLSSQATAEAMKVEFDRLVKSAQPGDAVVFFFSGHGTQVEDMDDDELDGLDESLCAYDHDSQDKDTHFTDDELRAYLGALKTDRVLVVMDCCHSGTGTRVGGIPAKQGIKMIPSAFHPGPRQSFRGSPGTSMKTVVRSDSGMRHLLIAGCAADEVSYEDRKLMGGVVTHAFVNHASGINVDVPITTVSNQVKKQALDWVRVHMPGMKPQNVQFEGSMKGTLRDLLLKEGPKIEVVAPPQLDPASSQPREVMLTMKTSKPIYKSGGFMGVTVTPDRACHLRLYYTDQDGKSYLIFPNKFHQDDKVSGGQAVEIGGQGSKFAFQLIFPENFDGPEVGEILTAVASNSPFTDAIESWGESTTVELPNVARGALSTRGVRIQQRPGIATASYRIQRP